jgi:hypothetical protein
MLDEYGVLINLMVSIVGALTLLLGGSVFFFNVYKYVLSNRKSDENIKKTEQEKLLECVYSPLENAISVFDNEFEKDKLNTNQQFEKFETACLGVKDKYGYLIDDETNKYIDDLSRANKVLNNLHDEENFGSLGASIKILRDHLNNKIR